MSEFVKFQVTDDLRALQDDTLKKIAKSGKIRIGINEVTKAIERGVAKLVVIAEDVAPAEIVMHIPIIAKEKNVPFSYAKTKEELGKSVGISAKASSIAVVDAGVSGKELTSLISKISEITGEKKAAPKAAEAKAEPKAEKKEKVKKEEPIIKEEPKTEEASE